MADDVPRDARDARDPRPARQAVPTGREPPHNAELERAVLAALLDGRSPVAIQKVRPILEHPLSFYVRDHRMVYLACLELDDDGQPIDMHGVADLLSRYKFQAVLDKLRQQQLLLESDQLDAMGRARLKALWRREGADLTEAYEDSALAAIGGFSALGDLSNVVGPVSAIERNATLLIDHYRKRKLITRLTAIADRAFRTPDSFDKLLDEGNQTLLDLGRGLSAATIHSIETVVDETLDTIVDRQNNPDQGIKTGIADLDEKLMALRPGGLYIIAARPGVGKTSFALKIMASIVSREGSDYRGLFVSLEVDRKDLLKKLVSAEGGIDFRKIEEGRLDHDEMTTLAGTLQRLKTWRMDLMDVTDLTVHGLRALVKRRQLEMGGGLHLVVLDYLQLLNGTRADMNEHEKVSEISRILKTLSMELKIPVVALSQMNRDSEKGAGAVSRPPKLADLRGSGAIEQDADAVIFLHRVDAGDGEKNEDGPDTARKIKVIVAKNRFGPQGDLDMNFFPAKMRFEMAAHERDGGPDRAPERKERFRQEPNEGEDVF